MKIDDFKEKNLMKKKILLSFMVVVISILAFGAVSTSASTFGELTYSTLPNGTIGITGYNEYATDEIVIPSEISGKKVTYIDQSAFMGNTTLISISIPDTVTGIGDYAFADCWRLTNIDIPNSVTHIGEHAFSGSGLTSVSISNRITTISYYAFNYTELRSVIIPNSVTSIENYAFAGCANLTDVYYNGTEEEWNEISIGDGNSPLTSAAIYFYEITDGKVTITECDTSVTGELVIPSTIEGYPVTSIGGYAFFSCSNITSIIIPDSVTNIEDSTFLNCGSLKSIIVDDNNPNYCSIDGVLFNKNKIILILHPSGKADIEHIVPDSVTSIGNNAFADCSNLTSITIPDSVTNIGNDAFLNCGSLTNITIPDSVTSIGNSAFYGCESLTNITIPNSVTSIGEGAFVWCTGLKRMTIPDGVTSIGDDVFGLCSSLESITIPDGVISIGDYAFYDCNNLTDVYYKGTEEEWNEISIGDGNSHLTSAVIHFKDNNEQIPECLTYEIIDGEVTITGCDTSVAGELVIPPTIWGYPVTSIGTSAFSECSSLENITIPNGVIAIENACFRDCSALTSITIPNTVTNMGKYVFENCKNLCYVSLGNGLTHIDKRSFKDCVSLEKIVIPNSVVEIGSEAFRNCQSLKSVEFSDNVDSIGVMAFYNCDSLEKVYFKGSKNELRALYTFDGNVEIMCIPATLTSVSENRKIFTVKPVNLTSGNIIMLALYEHKKMVEIHILTYTNEAVSFTTTKDYTKAKVMVWDNSTNLKPVCNIENVQ